MQVNKRKEPSHYEGKRRKTMTNKKMNPIIELAKTL